ncbi:24672_t:CDS:2 [Dentiscutata erythropus]|uniref:24672_t:CDS:1 n=1 Tax=Dentiscutata erythropus TaxID=1348616 RepID=A0A9N9AKW7_9GLOM|nr:24672_t:CDS:2 [Dentiscutata erythropus]
MKKSKKLQNINTNSEAKTEIYKQQCIQATTYDNDTYDTYEYDIYKQQLLRWIFISNDK